MKFRERAWIAVIRARINSVLRQARYRYIRAQARPTVQGLRHICCDAWKGVFQGRQVVSAGLLQLREAGPPLGHQGPAKA